MILLWLQIGKQRWIHFIMCWNQNNFFVISEDIFVFDALMKHRTFLKDAAILTGAAVKCSSRSDFRGSNVLIIKYL